MKRILIYLAALALTAFAPVTGNEIGRLHPVEVVLVYRDEQQVVIKTDTGDWGTGEDVAAALENLHEITAGYVYLDTADYLLIAPGAQEDADQLRCVLRSKLRLCYADREADLKLAAQYLPAHGQLPQLKHWDPSQPLPYLTRFEKKLKLLENTP